MPYLLWSRLLVLCVVMTGLFAPDAAMAQEADPDETREAAIVARFMTVLEKSPKRGTALDKVYGFHVERGSLESLIKTYRDKATAGKGPDAASAWMIVGLMESLRGQDAASVDAFSKAEELDAANYLASYYLGQSQVLIGQPDKAAESLERAIQRKPSQADQLEIFQALGRVYQRAQKNDKALGVWSRLEKQFPNDARVQEQIATTLLE
jgi:tetratricopeptide (TPR) repeat protein